MLIVALLRSCKLRAIAVFFVLFFVLLSDFILCWVFLFPAASTFPSRIVFPSDSSHNVTGLRYISSSNNVTTVEKNEIIEPKLFKNNDLYLLLVKKENMIVLPKITKVLSTFNLIIHMSKLDENNKPNNAGKTKSHHKIHLPFGQGSGHCRHWQLTPSIGRLTGKKTALKNQPEL